MQPINPNSLFDCVRLGENTPPNLTKSASNRNGRPLVDPDVETEDCAEYYVQGLGGNLPHSPVCRSHLFRLECRKIIGNAVNVPNLPSNPAMSRRVVHMKLILGSYSHYHRPSAPQRSRPRSKVRGNEPAIDLFGYPASPQTKKAFRARLKTLARFYFRDVHQPWTKESDLFRFLIEELLEQFPQASWDDGVVSKVVSSILRRRRHEYQKVAARGGMKSYSYSFCFYFFLNYFLANI